MKTKPFLNTLVSTLLLIGGLTSCGNDAPSNTKPNTDNSELQEEGSGNGNSENDSDKGHKAGIAMGGDISWITEMEADGIKFHNYDGTQANCMEILKSLGFNSFRFRVWVNPSNKYCTTEDVVAKCLRAKAFGIDIMIDFHYSDNWADPSKQNTPEQWKSLTIDALVQKVTEYTTATCQKLKDNGIEPKWVQVGNETSDGMLWPLGKASTNPKNFARLFKAGYDAVKSVYPDTKVIAHVDRAQEYNHLEWLYGILADNGATFDVMGLSLYPEKNNYVSYVAQTEANMKKLIQKFGCDVMLVEVGMGESYATECYDFLTRCFKLSESITDNRMLGVLYWEPQCNSNWNDYNKGTFNSQWRPTDALKAYNDFIASGN